jgi:hypothetical protein
LKRERRQWTDQRPRQAWMTRTGGVDGQGAQGLPSGEISKRSILPTRQLCRAKTVICVLSARSQAPSQSHQRRAHNCRRGRGRVAGPWTLCSMPKGAASSTVWWSVSSGGGETPGHDRARQGTTGRTAMIRNRSLPCCSFSACCCARCRLAGWRVLEMSSSAEAAPLHQHKCGKRSRAVAQNNVISRFRYTQSARQVQGRLQSRLHSRQPPPYSIITIDITQARRMQVAGHAQLLSTSRATQAFALRQVATMAACSLL